MLLFVNTTSTLGSVVDFTVSLYVGSVRVALALAIELPVQAMTIWPPGTTNTRLPVDAEIEGDELAGGDDEGVVGEGEGEVGGVGDAGGLTGGGVVDGAALGEFTGSGEWWLGLPVVVPAGVPRLAVGPGFDGVVWAVGEAVCGGAADDRLAAAEAEFWLTWADTLAGDTTRGVEPETSWPTRLTAVNVTAVTRAHDMIQPIASVSGRVDQLRGLIALIGDAAASRRRLR